MADPAAPPPPPPSTTPNLVLDKAPDINTQQGEQGRTKAERATEERRIKENQDNRQLNTVAPWHRPRLSSTPRVLTQVSPSLFPPTNDFYNRLSDYSLVVGYSVLYPTQKTNISM